MEPQQEFAVILIGSWKPVDGRTSPVRVGQAVIWSFSSDLRTLRDLAAKVHPSWLLVGDLANGDDALMPLIAGARAMAPGLRIAVLRPADDSERCERWVRCGSVLYLDPESTPERVAAAMQAVMELDIVATDGALLRVALARRAALQDNLLAMGGLSPAELDVLRLIRRGLRNADIAAELHLSTNTVQFHVRNVLSKLGARNRTEATERARELGL
jgi:DNA-binding NarL/FixJ family response regulator